MQKHVKPCKLLHRRRIFMIVSSTQDRIIECWCPNSDLPDLDNSNYYRGDPQTGIEFVSDNNINHDYLPVQQGSFIVDQDNTVVYSYIVDSNPGESTGQTGHWKSL